MLSCPKQPSSRTDQNPNPNPTLERQMGEVLCILCADRLFVVDMDDIMRDEEDCKEGTGSGTETPLKWLPVKRALDFRKSGLPFGMGLAKWRNFLYMFGGYIPMERDSVGIGFNSGGSIRFGYKLDLTKNQSEPVSLRSMSGPKLFPMVEVIGDNIYVLSEIIFSGERPSFEVFNPMTEEWRTLPHPLPLPGRGMKLHSYSVCGTVITCYISGRYCRFNTIIEEWEYPNSEDITPSEEMCMLGRPDVRNKDVYLTHGDVEDDEFWAMTETGWPKGNDGCSILFNPTDLYPPLPDQFKRGTLMTLADTSDQGDYMCGIVEYSKFSTEEDCLEQPIAMALHIIVFQVEKQESDGVVPAARLSIRYLRHQVYEIKSEDGLRPGFRIRKAVIGRLSYNTQMGSNSECLREEQGGLENKKKSRRKGVSTEQSSSINLVS